jgi:spore maturation protein CgeB
VSRHSGNALLLKLPHLDDVCFSDQKSFRLLAERYVNDRSARDAIANAQREFVKDRFTYSAHMRRVMQEIRDRIASER